MGWPKSVSKVVFLKAQVQSPQSPLNMADVEASDYIPSAGQWRQLDPWESSDSPGSLLGEFQVNERPGLKNICGQYMNKWHLRLLSHTHTHVCVPLYTCTFLHSTYKNKHTQSIQMYRTLDGKPDGCLTSRELPVTWHSCEKQSVLQWNGFQVYGQDPCVSQSVEKKHMQINVSNKVLTFGNDLFLIKLM